MTLRRGLLLGLTGTLLLVYLACERDYGLLPEQDYDSIEEIVYSRHVQPLFNRKCATSGCHDAATAAEGFAMDSWESVMRGSEHGAMVIPFRPEKSHLIFHVNTDTTVAPVAAPRMPPDAPLSRSEVNFLMRWIREGAKNDAGQVPFAQPRAGKVYVTCQADDEVAVIDVESNLVMRMVSVGALDNRVTPPEGPHNIVVDRQRQFYYVNMIVSNEIWKYRVRDDAFVAKLSLGDRASPAQVALSTDGTLGYVSNFDLTGANRGIQIFDTQNMRLLGRVTDARIWAAHGVTVTHAGTTLWTANQQSDNIGILDLRDPSGFEILKVDPSVPDLPISAPRFGPYQIVFSPDDRFAYVTCRFSNDVRVFATETRNLIATIRVGTNPLILEISPDGQYVYVANRGTGTSPSRSVSVIHTGTYTELARIPDVGVEPHGVAVSRTGRYIYVSCENVSAPDAPHHPVAGLKTPGIVAVIDALTYRVVKRIEVGSFAAGITFVPSP
jgi:YVTN family beta-propeller protein